MCGKSQPHPFAVPTALRCHWGWRNAAFWLEPPKGVVVRAAASLGCVATRNRLFGCLAAVATSKRFLAQFWTHSVVLPPRCSPPLALVEAELASNSILNTAGWALTESSKKQGLG